MIKVTVWNEFYHEKTEEKVKAIYPEGLHKTIAEFLGKEEDIVVRCATLDDPDCGLTQEVLDDTDVLIWWGHMKHGDVPDEVVDRVQASVLKGMGMIFLHSAHHSKPFKRLMGTTCNLGWRDEVFERVWVVDPASPITHQGSQLAERQEKKRNHTVHYGAGWNLFLAKTAMNSNKKKSTSNPQKAVVPESPG